MRSAPTAKRGSRWCRRRPPASPPPPVYAAPAADAERERRAGRLGFASMIKRMVFMLAAVALVLGGVFGYQVFKGMMIKKFMAAMASPPPPASASKVSYSDWQSKGEAIGSLR